MLNERTKSTIIQHLSYIAEDKNIQYNNAVFDTYANRKYGILCTLDEKLVRLFNVFVDVIEEGKSTEYFYKTCLDDLEDSINYCLYYLVCTQVDRIAEGEDRQDYHTKVMEAYLHILSGNLNIMLAKQEAYGRYDNTVLNIDPVHKLMFRLNHKVLFLSKSLPTVMSNEQEDISDMDGGNLMKDILGILLLLYIYSNNVIQEEEELDNLIDLDNISWVV